MIKSILYVSVIVFCCLLAASTFGQTRQMYSWTDENGVVHFSDMKPAGQEVQLIEIPDSPEPVSGVPEVPPVEGEEPSLAEQRREKLAIRRAEEQKIAAENAAKCSAWNSEIAELEPNRRVYFTNDKGETQRMDDVVRTDRVAELKKQVAQYCK